MAASRTPEQPSEDRGTLPTFEQALAELEATIDALERPDLPLESSLELFEKGVALIKTCDSHLQKAQGRVKALLKGEHGELVEKIIGPSLESFLSRDSMSDA